MRYWFRARRIGNVDEFSQKIMHQVVIPVGERYDNFFVIEILEWVFRVMHNERAPDSIWVLASFMTVVPVCSRLVDLF